MQPAVDAPLSPSSKHFLRRGVRYGGLVVAIALTIIGWTNLMWPNRYYLAPWAFGEGIYEVQTAEKLVALTFDDGPDPRYTQQISQILRDAGARSTFFVIGRHAAQYPELIDTLIQQGHELGNHTWNHADLRLKPLLEIRSELESTDHLLRERGYEASIPFRSPFGYSLLALPRILKQRHQPNVLWTIQLNDWRPETPDVMMELLEPAFHRGMIILLHDGDGRFVRGDRSNTVEVVKRILATYIPQGYQFVTVSELLARGKPQYHWSW